LNCILKSVKVDKGAEFLPNMWCLMLCKIIVKTMVPGWPLVNLEDRSVVINDVTCNVRSSLAQAPIHIKVAVNVLSLPLVVVIAFTTFFSPSEQSLIYNADKFYFCLRYIPGPLFSVVRLYRSLTVLAFYEHPLIQPLL
jgi:hypothetical protein